VTTVKVKLQGDVEVCGEVARVTQGLKSVGVSLDTWRAWLDSEHSMIRAINLVVEIEDIPSFASVHLVRHKIGVEHFVRSQRDTAINPVNYDRHKAPQDALVNHTMVLNPQALINISRRRLCHKADEVTRGIWAQVKEAIATHENPYIAAIAQVMVPNCEYRRGCHEMKPCGYYSAAESSAI